MSSKITASEKGGWTLNETRKHVRICLREFEAKYGRMPSTREEIEYVKGQAGLMDMVAEAMIEPEFLNKKTEWVEA